MRINSLFCERAIAEQQRKLALANNEVHIWQFQLEGELDLSSFWPVLSAPETHKSERFRFEEVRAAYVVSHATLRWLLAGYGVASASAIEFDYDPNGKPHVLPKHSHRLDFSISHTRGMVGLALAHVSVGVDAERIRPLVDEEDLVRRYYTPEECQAYLTAEPELRSQAFFKCWTRKEALAKMTGRGLAEVLDPEPHPISPFEALQTNNKSIERPLIPKRWITDCSLVPGYTFAVAVEQWPNNMQNNHLTIWS